MRRVEHDERLEKEVIANCIRWLNEFKMGYCESIGQRKAKGSGSSLGAPDMIVYSRGKVFIVEMKRPHGGVLSEDQRIAIEARKREGVETWVISNEQEFVDMICGRG